MGSGTDCEIFYIFGEYVLACKIEMADCLFGFSELTLIRVEVLPAHYKKI